MFAAPTQASISDDMRRLIEARLAEIEGAEDVRILLAVESGSRAWGFASPDSDYDVRFVYAHRPDWYLSVQPRSDVIERPITDDLDLVGWDVKKAMSLLVKPNPALAEWLASPIRYRWEADYADPLCDFLQDTAFVAPMRHHYINYAVTKWDEHIDGRDEVKLKRYFYVIRPALCLRWLSRFASPPPVPLQDLVDGAGLSADERAEIRRLVELKSGLSEAGMIPRVPVLDQMIDRLITEARVLPADRVRPGLAAAADDLLRRCVHGLGKQ